MRIFLDANILFSAAKTDGAIRRWLALIAEAGHECHADTYVVEEARRNVALKAPDSLPALDRLVPRIHVAQVKPGVAEAEAVRSLPEKDRPVLAAAIQLGCQVLVTGDRTHFGALYGKTLGGVKIHSPRSLAEMLLG